MAVPSTYVRITEWKRWETAAEAVNGSSAFIKLHINFQLIISDVNLYVMAGYKYMGMLSSVNRLTVCR